MLGITEELKFWEEFVKTRPFQDGWLAQTITPDLWLEAASFILSHKHDKVLDVGSGVVSILNGLLTKEQLLTIDPLADEYAKFFDYEKHDIIKPVPVCGEELNCHNMFDIVHMSNALDHSQDPLKVYANLVKAVKPGGYVIVQGFDREATAQNYQGMHQWDLYILGNILWAENKESIYKIAKTNCISRQTTTPQKRQWFMFIEQKEINA